MSKLNVLKKDVEALIKKFKTIRDDFDRIKNPTPEYFNKLINYVKEIQKEFKEISKRTGSPAGILDEIDTHVNQIKAYLNSVSKGENLIGKVEFHTNEIKKLFNEFEEIKNDIKKLGDNLDEINSDIEFEQGGKKGASIKNITLRLDKIAENLQESGHPKFALALDKISDQMEKRS